MVVLTVQVLPVQRVPVLRAPGHAELGGQAVQPHVALPAGVCSHQEQEGNSLAAQPRRGGRAPFSKNFLKNLFAQTIISNNLQLI